MKTLFLAILVLLVSVNIFAAPPVVHTIESSTVVGKQVEKTYFDVESHVADKRLLASYNSEGNLVERTIFQWKASTGWNPLYKHVYVYDSANDISTVTCLSWHDNRKEWYNKTVAVYNTMADLSVSVSISNSRK